MSEAVDTMFVAPPPRRLQLMRIVLELDVLHLDPWILPVRVCPVRKQPLKVVED